MLDQMLQRIGHLPVLMLVLAFVPPSAWQRLRRAARCFHDVLVRDQLASLVAFSGPKPTIGSMLEVVDKALNMSGSELLAETTEEWAVESQRTLDQLEIAECDVVYMTLFEHVGVDVPEPATGITPLMRASEEGRWRLCHLLLSHCADANRVSIGGATALLLALDSACGRCQATSWPRWCNCPRDALASLLLHRTDARLPESLAATVRLALQNERFIPLISKFVREKKLEIDVEILGPDSRRGTPISVALERRVSPTEAPLVHRPKVVEALLQLGANASKRGAFCAWWGGKPAHSLLEFAAANSCDMETILLLQTAS